MKAGAAARWLAFIADALGYAGWCGVAALTVAAAVLAFVVPAMERANAQQALEIAALDHRMAQLHDPRVRHVTSDPVAALIASLPPAAEVADFLATLQSRAEQASVQIDRTEYRVQPLFGHAAQRYRLSFPAHVDYPHLRQWLETTLHDYPSVALDELSLRREVDGGEELDAHIGLSFLAREGR